jgi:hypothetical protein
VHHLTAGELVLTGSAITAVSSAVVALVVARTGKRRDHVARLWERRVEVYESVLVQVDWHRELRAETTRTVKRDEPELVTPSSPIPEDENEGRQIRARLQTYGERKVREAYERYLQSEAQVMVSCIDWYHAATTNLKVSQGAAPGHLAVTEAELVRLRKAVESANDRATLKQEKFEATVAKAVGRLPRYERRAWRRLKAPAVD